MNRVVGVIQARMNSTRLPGKVMRTFMDRPVVGHIADRLLEVPGIDEIVIATSCDPKNDVLEAFADRENFLTYREKGEDDIAARLAGACTTANATAILKVNADCPMVDPLILSELMRCYLQNPEADYISNKSLGFYPLGMTGEILSQRALNYCHKNLSAELDREYVCDWISKHPDLFNVIKPESKYSSEKLGTLDWTLDTPAQFSTMDQIFKTLYPKNRFFGMQDVLEIWRENES